ncbi:MAG: hypothetical protein OXE52_15280 [Chloroflexi bacterium]|nr:hypothetical protein [Chloroflexota bacterium]
MQMVFRAAFGPLVLILAWLLSACGGESSAPGATRQSLQRASFASNGLSPGFALDFPASWRYQASEASIMLSNDPELLSKSDDDPAIPSGALAVNISLLSEDQARAIGAREAAAVIDAFGGASTNDALRRRYRDTNAITIEGREGAQSLVSVAGSDSLLLALELEGNFVLAVAVAPEGELQQHTNSLYAIFASVEPLASS